MRPDNRALLTLLVAVGIVVSIVGAAIFLTALPTALPISTGTTFFGNDVRTWIAHFNVSTTGSRVVGAWTAFDGDGFPALVVVEGTVAALPGETFYCPLRQHWTEFNGSIDVPVDPGTHSLFWSPCFAASKVVITEAIRVA